VGECGVVLAVCMVPDCCMGECVVGVAVCVGAMSVCVVVSGC